MSVDQSLYAVAPSERDLRPGMVVIFELYILRGKSSASDHAVCWGAFPIVNNDFTVVSGKCPVPLKSRSCRARRLYLPHVPLLYGTKPPVYRPK